MLNRNAHRKLNLIVRRVSRESMKKAARSRRSERTRTMSAASTVTSCPAPIAMPMSAVASAGASFTPSPTIATTLCCLPLPPWARSLSTVLTLSAGRASATTRDSSMPHWRATLRAATRWSPLHIQTSTPATCSDATHDRACGANASCRATAASGTPSTARATTVAPPARMAAIHSGSASPAPAGTPLRSSRTLVAEATSTTRPARVHRTPTPVMFSKVLGFVSGPLATAPAVSTSAFATGCSLDTSAEPMAHHSARSTSPRINCAGLAAASTFGSTPSWALPYSCSHVIATAGRSGAPRAEAPVALRCASTSTCSARCCEAPAAQAAAASVTRGRPHVRVPVLSRTTLLTFEPSSRGTAPVRTKMPCLAAAPVAAMTAVGVASPSAQGQATSSTVRPCSSTKKNLSISGHWLERPSRMEDSGIRSRR
mmetsp:Transcript_97741/g.262610  ORF Transcript_97741/g.262610 Transcript_97741/m.262610 type:complete len:428 (+) Transcript_97741:451-1734(+)